MRFPFGRAVLVSVCATACGNPLTGTALHGGTAADAGPGSDASQDAPADSADASIECSGPLPDAGFVSLAQLPVTQLCAESGAGGYGPGVVLESLPCGGSILVWSTTATDCGSFWLFETATGALQAVGGGCNGGLVCTGAASGFQFPNQCWSPPPNLEGAEELCPDAAAAPSPDASED